MNAYKQKFLWSWWLSGVRETLALFIVLVWFSFVGKINLFFSFVVSGVFLVYRACLVYLNMQAELNMRISQINSSLDGLSENHVHVEQKIYKLFRSWGFVDALLNKMVDTVMSDVNVMVEVANIKDYKYNERLYHPFIYSIVLLLGGVFALCGGAIIMLLSSYYLFLLILVLMICDILETEIFWGHSGWKISGWIIMYGVFLFMTYLKNYVEYS